jgi:hypothetical protein
MVPLLQQRQLHHRPQLLLLVPAVVAPFLLHVPIRRQRLLQQQQLQLQRVRNQVHFCYPPEGRSRSSRTISSSPSCRFPVSYHQFYFHPTHHHNTVARNSSMLLRCSTTTTTTTMPHSWCYPPYDAVAVRQCRSFVVVADDTNATAATNSSTITTAPSISASASASSLLQPPPAAAASSNIMGAAAAGVVHTNTLHFHNVLIVIKQTAYEEYSQVRYGMD